MTIDENELWEGYAIDAAEALTDIEESLLALERAPASKDHINRLYRGLHTVKGNSGFVGAHRLEQLAHAAEDLIGLVRDGGVPFEPAMAELMLGVVDALRRAVELVGKTHTDVSAELTDGHTAAVKALLARGGRSAPAIAAGPAPVPHVTMAEVTSTWDPHDAVDVIDPASDAGFVEVFLALAAEALPAVSAALVELMSPETSADAKAQLFTLFDDLGLASERMGYQPIVEALAQLQLAMASATEYDELSERELALYELVVAIEEDYQRLTEAPQAFGMIAIWQRACANMAFGDLARLRDLLANPGMVEAAEIHGRLKRLRGACEFYGLSAAVHACLVEDDALGRALELGAPPGEELVGRVFEFIEQLGATIAAVNAGEEGSDVVVESPDDDPMRFSPEISALPMSEELRAQLTLTMLGALSEAQSRGWRILQVNADLERAPALVEPFMTWMGAGDTALVTSAVVEPGADQPSGGPIGYHFLVTTSATVTAAKAALAAIDRTGALLVAHALEVGGQAPPRAHVATAAAPAVAAVPVVAAKPTAAAAAAALVVASPPTNVVSPPANVASPLPIAEAAVEPTREDGGEERGRQTEFLRIDARKVSMIMDLAGEIGLASSAVTQHAELAGQELEGFQAAAHKLEMLIRELQTEVSGMRLVPVAGVFSRMKRVVRDTARRTGKQVELVLLGEDTEIDKVMVDALHDPLVHMLRNAIDHGVELPEARLAAGKPASGTVILEASHQGGEVVVTISDDGRGLDREKILARGRERGLVAADAALRDDEIFDLIFQPGFSTKDTIDELSGRGVGMDVVKTTIEGLRGRVAVRSNPGRGSRMSLSVPLTLAFVEAMVVRERDRLFAVPIERVHEVFKADARQLARSSADGQTLVRVRDALVPVLWLHRYYGEADRPEDLATLEGRVIVVVQTSHGDLALPVDGLLGNQQLMLKPLRGVLSGVRAAAGCGMMRSGDVAVTLDCEQLHV
jgi:two-component system chemotaxis sensor kinase CheA